MTNYTTVNHYIASFSKEVRSILQKVRKNIKKAAPDAMEAFSYGMPTFKLKGKNLVHFAGYKNHIGFYPTPSGIDNFKNELSEYKTSRGAIQFPLDSPIPYDLIAKIVKYRVKELTLSSK